MKDHSWALNAYDCASQRWKAQYPRDPDPWETDRAPLPFSVWGDQFTGLQILSHISEVLLARFFLPLSEEERLYDEQGGGQW